VDSNGSMPSGSTSLTGSGCIGCIRTVSRLGPSLHLPQNGSSFSAGHSSLSQ
jgi:hypothetical protein